MVNSKKGIAMLMVISLILLLLILGGAVLMVSTGHFSTSHHQIERARAYYAAEAGLQHALWSCREGAYNLITGGSDTITVQDPNYTPTVNITIGPKDANGRNEISATVDY